MSPELTLIFVVLVIVAIVAVFYALPIWTIVDAARRPDWQFQLTGTNKTVWIVLAIVGMVVCAPVGLVSGIIYLASVRPKLEQIQPPHGWGYTPWGPTPFPGYAPPPPMPPPGAPPGPSWPQNPPPPPPPPPAKG
ncbi:MAG TPA: DUF2516 family protein [Acidimicrobiales bacterium]|jgi:hypothetical protein|nr:DUF2516 family protein [Acidimicrobiales bacterium]